MKSSEKITSKRHTPSAFAKASTDAKAVVDRSEDKESIVEKYNPSEIEAKWQEKWEKERIYSPNLDASASLSTKKPFYNLMMFPYPSAEGMHVGNMYAFTGADVYGRFKRMQGFSVFEPIGLDGFGIHSENYAIKVGKHPVEQAKISEKNFYRQLRSIGNSFDWTRTVETYKPEYYKWTQWLFIQLFKAGLAYRKKAPVNFCPSCKTVLSDEQVMDGACERCNSVVEKKDLEQWFFKITKYADRLLSNLTQIDWAEKVKIAQRQWIGKSEGALIKFKIEEIGREVEVFTTRADTLFGATFLVLSPEHPIVSGFIEGNFDSPSSPRSLLVELKDYVAKAKKKSDIERTEEKTGVFTGIYAINPVNNEKIPVWVADYVLMGYGTGAIMAVPAHDKRDFEFARKFELEVKQVIAGGDIDKEAYIGQGEIINSGDWNGWKTPESIQKVIDWIEKKGLGRKEANYHLRDWLISRQRYWGPPIPMIYCEKCAKQGITYSPNVILGTQSEAWRTPESGKDADSGQARMTSSMEGWFPEENLPVKLPFIKDYKPLGTGKAPLASHPEFYETKCPKCGGEAKRETDVSDTFLDSAWYFLKYVSTDIKTTAFDVERVKKWLPVNMYIGGAEHSVLHLLYSRFITMALHDMGHINFEEPFTKFRAHGLIVKDGAKMSKSKGNVVIPDAYVKKFGADTLRAYLMFMGPYSQGGDFRDSGIEGMHRFLRRVWALVSAGPVASFPPASARSAGAHVRAVGIPSSGATRLQMMHKTIKKVTEDIENLSYNTAIAALMEYYNFLSDQKAICREEVEVFLKLLAPFAPHVSEELFSMISSDKNWQSIHLSAWPVYDPKFLVKSEMTIVVQINGKLRGSLIVNSEKLNPPAGGKSYVEDLAKNDPNVIKHLEGREIKKIIYIEGKVINFVI